MGQGGGKATVGGYDEYPCVNDGECVGSRVCYDKHMGRGCWAGRVTMGCVCVGRGNRRKSCHGEQDCDEGEVCSNQAEGTDLRVGVCMSRRLGEQVAQTVQGLEIGDRVCVAAEFVEKGDGVYKDGVLARVLCDRSGSCATEGHMVRWHGTGMMMKNYCDMVGCVTEVKFVNSPRFRVGKIVQSKTKGLVFTALAARYGTWVEEKFMAGLMAVGV